MGNDIPRMSSAYDDFTPCLSAARYKTLLHDSTDTQSHKRPPVLFEMKTRRHTQARLRVHSVILVRPCAQTRTVILWTLDGNYLARQTIHHIIQVRQTAIANIGDKSPRTAGPCTTSLALSSSKSSVRSLGARPDFLAAATSLRYDCRSMVTDI